MKDSVSELAEKYREEMLNMYRRRPPRPPERPPMPPQPPRPPERPPMPSRPPERPPMPPPCPPCPPCPPPRPQPRDSIPVSVEPDEPPEQPEVIQLSEPAEEETPEIIGEPLEEIVMEENPPDQGDYEEPALPEYIQPEPPPIPEQWKAQEEYEKRNSSEGKIYVVAASADSAYPVPGARVTIYTKIGDQIQLDYLLITDESGATPVVTLPAPPALLSQDPENKNPYAVCDIKIYASGYFREEARNVPIFAGVTSRQEFQMIPLPAGVFEDAETIVLPSESEPQ